jgi:hypothetical protein
VVFGFTKVEGALAEGRLIALLHAREAAADGTGKLEAVLARAERAGNPAPARVRGLAGGQLDLALGRSNVVHAALLAHPASASFLARCQTLDHWRNGGPAGEPAAAGGRANRD